jgi:hypothetical protein
LYSVRVGGIINDKYKAEASGGYGDVTVCEGVMFEGPAMVIVWLSTPAIVVIGSVVAALAFEAIPKLLDSRAREVLTAVALIAGAGVLGAFATNTYSGRYMSVLSTNALEPEHYVGLIAP